MEAGIQLEASEKKGYSPLMIILILLLVVEVARTVYMVKKKGKTVKGSLQDDVKLLGTPTAIVAVIGFVTGVMEFVIASNVKQHGFPDSLKSGKIFTLPPKQDLIQTATIILVVSSITGVLTELALGKVREETLSAKLMG
jgi:uncharacterized membrane protein